MSLSAAAISKNHDALAKLISSWVESSPPATQDESKQEGVVTIALRTRPFLESEGKDVLNGVHARGRKMWVHVPSSKVRTPPKRVSFGLVNGGTVVEWSDGSA